MKTKLLLFVTTLLLPCLTASAVVSGWGDSLTFGSGGGGAGYLEQFQTLSGQAIYKQGWGGSNSTWIKDQFLLQSNHWGDQYIIIWSGRNNYTATNTVKADIADMVAHMTTTNYLIMGIINGNYAGEFKGQANYNTMIALNSSLAATYGNKYLDIRQILVNSYNPALPQDVIDFTNDTVPASLRADNIHLTATGYGIVASNVYAKYTNALATNAPVTDYYLTNSDAVGYSSFITNPAGQNTNWNNQLPPSAGNSYWVTNKNLRTPATSSAYTFAGDVLYIGGSSVQVLFQMKGSNVITVPNLQLGNLGIIQNAGTGYNPNTARLAGSINVVSNVVMKSGGTNATLALTATLTGTNNGNGINILGFTDVGGTIQLSGSHPYTGAISESGVRVEMDGTFSMTPASLTVGQNSQVVNLLATNGTPNNNFNTTNVVLAGGNLNVGNGVPITVLNVGMRTAFTPQRTNDPVVALLDVSKQPSFTANVGTLSVGIQGDGGNTCVGTILLATNNTIITTAAGGILIGNSAAAGNGASPASTMTLGAGSNLIDTASLTVAGAKTSGLLLLPAGGLLVLTNSGSGRANLNVANNATGTSASPTGNMDLSGGTVVASVDQLYVGRKSNGSTGSATGTLTLSADAANQVNVKNVFLGYMIGASAGAGGTARGTLTIGGGSVLVTNVTLAYLDVAGNGKSVGNLNLNGGTFTVAGAITNGLGSGTINLANATLIAANTVGTLAARITTLALTNSILQFGASSVITNFAVSNLFVGGTANTIKILSAPTNDYMVTLPLISYVNFSGTNNFQPDFTILSNTYPSLSFIGSIITSNNVLLLNLVIPSNLNTTNSTTTTLGSLSGSLYGQSVTLTATVSGTPMGGTVQFYDNGMALGSPMPVVSGQAQYATSALVVGGHPMTASYSGTTGFDPSTTASASTQTVSRATPVLTPPTAAMITIYGQVVTNATLSGGAATNNWNNANVPGSFVYTTPTTVPGVGTSAQGVTFTPVDTANYNNATTTVNVTVNPGLMSIIYVATNGNDAWSGTQAVPNGTNGPKASLAGAQVVVRAKLAQAGYKWPTVVEIADGTYALTNTFILGLSDSAGTTNPVLYQAAAGAHPVFSGGRVITGWTPGANGRWTAAVPWATGANYFEQLYIDGRRATRAITPNTDYYYIQEVYPVPTNQVFAGYAADVASLAGLSAADLTNVTVISYQKWSASRLRLASFNAASNLLTFSGASHYAFLSGNRYQIENLASALDQPGEWFLANGALTYWPLPGEDMNKAQVVAPQNESLIKITGDLATSQFIRNLTFSGLSFQYGLYQLPAAGDSERQALADLPAAIAVNYARNVTFTNCEVAHIGQHAIYVNQGCMNCVVSHCYLYDLGGGGVYLGNQNTSDSDVKRTAFNIADNNIIRAGGRLHASAVGVWIGNSSSNSVTHNEISDLFYTGISVGWDMGYDTVANKAYGNRIHGNHIHDLGWRVLSDMGGVYTIGISPGTTVTGNYVHHISSYKYGGWGIYNDEGSSFILVASNLVHDTMDGGYMMNYGRTNTIQNNIFACARDSQLSYGHNTTTNATSYSNLFNNNIVYWLSGDNLSLQPDPINPTYSLFSSNLYWQVSSTNIDFDGRTFAQWQAMGQDAGSQIADPLFRDGPNRDFRFASPAAAAAIGFQPFDFTEAGVYGDPAWRILAQQPSQPDSLPEPVSFAPFDFNENFETLNPGARVPNADTFGIYNGASVIVTSNSPASGLRCLAVTTPPNQPKSWYPYFNYSPLDVTGNLSFAFSIWLEANTQMTHEWRNSTGSPFLSGPTFTLALGQLKVGGTVLTSVPSNQWLRVQIKVNTTNYAAQGWQLGLTKPGFATQWFTNYPSGANANWNQLSYLSWSGAAILTASNTYYLDDFSATNFVPVYVNPQPPAPVISSLTNCTIAANTSTGPQAFTVVDPALPANAVTVTVSSSNPRLLPANSLVLGGSGINQTITVTPATGQTGVGTVSVTADNGTFNASQSFDVTVQAVGGTNFLVYSVGNSLTQDMMSGGLRYCATTYQTSLGNTFIWGAAFKAGSALPFFYNVPDDSTTGTYAMASYSNVNTSIGYKSFPNNIRWTSALPSNNWDAVTLEPYPGAVDASGGGNATQGADTTVISGFITAAKSVGKNAATRFYIFEPWPPIHNYSDTNDYNNTWQTNVADSASQETMLCRGYFTNLFKAVKTTNPGIGMIPVGEVLYALDVKMKSGQVPGFTTVHQLHRDATHLNSLGKDIAAFTAYATIFKLSPVGLANNPNIGTNTYTAPYTDPVPSAAALQIMQQTIWDVVNQQNYYTLVSPPVVSPPVFSSVNLVGGNQLVLAGGGGTAYGFYYVLASTNVAQPLNQWQRIATNQFDGAGGFAVTNPITTGTSQQFFQLQLP